MILNASKLKRQIKYFLTTHEYRYIQLYSWLYTSWNAILIHIMFAPTTY